MNIYVGNISPKTSENQLLELFKVYGNVESLKIIIDHFTGTSRGFGFIEMKNEDAEEAIKQLNGKEMDGQMLTVNEAKPRSEDMNRGAGRSSYNDSRNSSQGGGFKKRW